MYCNLLQASHFGATSMGAWNADDRLVGSVTGYLLPSQPTSLFIWQVAVHPEARGQGLALRLLQALLAQPHTANITQVQTSITDANTASWRTFEALARSKSAATHKTVLFEHQQHFAGAAPTEYLFTIGPIEPKTQRTKESYARGRAQAHAPHRAPEPTPG